MLDLLYFWAHDALQTYVSKETRPSRKTINEWYMSCKVVCYEIMKLVKPKKIGGRGIVVQLSLIHI